MFWFLFLLFSFLFSSGETAKCKRIEYDYKVIINCNALAADTECKATVKTTTLSSSSMNETVEVEEEFSGKRMSVAEVAMNITRSQLFSSSVDLQSERAHTLEIHAKHGQILEAQQLTARCGNVLWELPFFRTVVSTPHPMEKPAELKSIQPTEPAEKKGWSGSRKSMKIVENSRQLSAESGGRRILKSCHGTFLRAYDDERMVDMAPEANRWEKWYIEDWRGRVVFKAIHSPGRFLRAHPDGHVDLTLAHPKASQSAIWTPFKNDDGSWSFLSHHGKWLSADKNGSVYCVERCNSCEHFWLSRW